MKFASEVPPEDIEPTEWDFFRNRVPSRTYVSRSFSTGSFGIETSRRLRYVTKVIDSDASLECVVEARELVIRGGKSDRTQIKALVFEDDRSIKNLVIQRYESSTGKPHKGYHFSFQGDEISKLITLLELCSGAAFDDPLGFHIDNVEVDGFLQRDDDLLALLQRHRDRLSTMNLDDLPAFLTYCERRTQLQVFRSLLYDREFFAARKHELDVLRDEQVWQDFFERNVWIFGLSLQPIFLSALTGEKLEQVIRGYSIGNEGKRVDALMKTNGLLSSLCFIEIKTHRTPLIQQKAYRPGAWSVSGDVAGAVAQCHSTLQGAMSQLGNSLRPTDKQGNPTGDELFLYEPRSILVAGCLDEFITEDGLNQTKFRSFELMRRNLHRPEVITFDELYERAKATLHVVESRQTSENIDQLYDDLPF